jgi:hypothetical protein
MDNLPQVIVEYIFSFSDIDTRIKNHIKPNKLKNITLELKPHKITHLNGMTHIKIHQNYDISYIYRTNGILIRNFNIAIYYDKNMKLTKVYRFHSYYENWEEIENYSNDDWDLYEDWTLNEKWESLCDYYWILYHNLD